MKSKRLIFLLGIIASTLSACERGPSTPSVDRADLPHDDVIFGLHHVVTKNGVRSAVLRSDTAYLEENGQRFDLTGVNLQFYTETGAESGTLTSRTGEYDVKTGSFVARKDVVLITRGPQGERRIETEELVFDVATDQVRSDKPFVMTQDGTVTRGDSFTSDVHGNTWTAQGLKSEGVRAGGADLSF